MELLLVRHGLAGKQDPDKYPDDDLRALTSKGRKLIRTALEGLAGLNLKPSLILTSPALRCLQTAKLAGRAFDLDSKKIRPLPALLHTVSASATMAKLSSMRLPSSVILVGHEPRLSELISLLIAANLKVGVDITKGGTALLTIQEFKPGKGRLQWLLTQDQLVSLA